MADYTYRWDSNWTAPEWLVDTVPQEWGIIGYNSSSTDSATGQSYSPIYGYKPTLSSVWDITGYQNTTPEGAVTGQSWTPEYGYMPYMSPEQYWEQIYKATIPVADTSASTPMTQGTYAPTPTVWQSSNVIGPVTLDTLAQNYVVGDKDFVGERIYPIIKARGYTGSLDDFYSMWSRGGLSYAKDFDPGQWNSYSAIEQAYLLGLPITQEEADRARQERLYASNIMGQKLDAEDAESHNDFMSKVAQTAFTGMLGAGLTSLLGGSSLFGDSLLGNLFGSGSSGSFDMLPGFGEMLSGAGEAGALAQGATVGAGGVTPSFSDWLSQAANSAGTSTGSLIFDTSGNLVDGIGSITQGLPTGSTSGTGTAGTTGTTGTAGTTGTTSGWNYGPGVDGVDPVTGLTAAQAASQGTGLLNQLASSLGIPTNTLTGLLSSGASLLGGYLQGEQATDAQQQYAQALERIAKMNQFRPVGVTTRFGSSNFTIDPSTGQVTQAGYTLAPDVKAIQDRQMGMLPGLQTQYENVTNLGKGYLATTPQEQAAKYMAEQQALLATSRERDLANLQNKLMQQGRLGLATGGTSTGMMAANPDMEAYYNAIRQQDLGLASQATKGGMDYAKFGLDIQSQGYQPLQTALGAASYLEGLGQQPMDLGINIGAKGLAANQPSMELLAQSQKAMQPANAWSPWGAALQGAGGMLQNYMQPQQQGTSWYDPSKYRLTPIT